MKPENPARALPDLDDDKELTKLVRTFYVRVAHDDLLAPIFVDLAKVDWDTHVPKIVDFWRMVEFQIPGFDGSPFEKHQRFSKHIPFTAEHFERWVSLFHDTVDRLVAGPRAESIKQRAEQIAIIQSNRVTNAEAWDGL